MILAEQSNRYIAIVDSQEFKNNYRGNRRMDSPYDFCIELSKQKQ